MGGPGSGRLYRIKREKSDVKVAVVLTPREKRMLHRAAKRYGASMSEYCRQLIVQAETALRLRAKIKVDTSKKSA